MEMSEPSAVERRVVVGYDGSEQARAAVDWAANEARPTAAAVRWKLSTSSTGRRAARTWSPARGRRNRS
jgi:nucleotide-binding universal stress UspA family protein